MLALKEKDKVVAQMLLTSGTCARCILRFCGVTLQSPYGLPYKDLICELREFLALDIDEELRLENDTEADGPPNKKIRCEDTEEGSCDQRGGNAANLLQLDGNVSPPNDHSRTCNVCLGILQEFSDADFVKRHAAWLLVKQEMGKQGLSLQKEDIIQIKEAYKWITHPMFADALGVQVDPKSEFEVSVVYAHPETDGDCHFLATKCPDCFKATKNKLSVFTRMAVVKALEKIKEEDFLKQFPCLPSSPETRCDVLEIQCSHAAIFVAGRYNKYSRNLPQTPWIIDGERKMDSSVEELILEPLMAVFKADSFNFSSSGREDVDVRTLGKGRPFAVELVNPRKVKFTTKDIKEIQQEINHSSDKIKVRDLQVVTRDAVGHMKEGEEEKTKCYSALIWTEKFIQREDIAFLDDMKELKLDQKTPLRVLHRRPLAVRVRIIHTMRTEYVDEHHFRLYLKTQAGTYIKEFVHGDFGRTQPNIGSLMKTTADILQLDVESVDVDWPPPLND
ncbi:tRNA pseudouridine synthase Pus10 isoform X2 [Ambystoma mexicanum]|uniref:tRNA pseudouridine synthase Pus10 isoform X2 n=1 Tax=Ambystoma mexicanum TaxID=8296 RepID=UPI0037E88057